LLSLLDNIHVTFPNSIALSPPSCDRVIACAFHVSFYTFGEIIHIITTTAEKMARHDEKVVWLWQKIG